eukprot:scaffold51442_cov75-Phaeocystis_antarctica.AAC.1
MAGLAMGPIVMGQTNARGTGAERGMLSTWRAGGQKSSTALKTQSTQAIDNKVQFQSQYRPCHQTWRTRLNDLVMGRTIESGREGSGGSQAEIASPWDEAKPITTRPSGNCVEEPVNVLSKRCVASDAEAERRPLERFLSQSLMERPERRAWTLNLPACTLEGQPRSAQ